MINVNVVKRNQVGSNLPMQRVNNTSRIRLTPDVIEMITNAAVQIITTVVMGVVAVVLKQPMPPAV